MTAVAVVLIAAVCAVRRSCLSPALLASCSSSTSVWLRAGAKWWMAMSPLGGRFVRLKLDVIASPR
jgi:hypothetical protein